MRTEALTQVGALIYLGEGAHYTNCNVTAPVFFIFL